MRRRTRHILVYASIIALAFLELSSTQKGEMLRHPAAEVGAASEISVGPLLFRPRVVPPSAPAISVRVVNLPGVVTISQAGQLPSAVCDLASLQKEHVRIQI
jgi:hypothetical protein